MTYGAVGPGPPGPGCPATSPARRPPAPPAPTRRGCAGRRRCPAPAGTQQHELRPTPLVARPAASTMSPARVASTPAARSPREGSGPLDLGGERAQRNVDALGQGASGGWLRCITCRPSISWSQLAGVIRVGAQRYRQFAGSADPSAASLTAGSVSATTPVGVAGGRVLARFDDRRAWGSVVPGARSEVDGAEQPRHPAAGSGRERRPCTGAAAMLQTAADAQLEPAGHVDVERHLDRPARERTVRAAIRASPQGARALDVGQRPQARPAAGRAAAGRRPTTRRLRADSTAYHCWSPARAAAREPCAVRLERRGRRPARSSATASGRGCTSGPGRSAGR